MQKLLLIFLLACAVFAACTKKGELIPVSSPSTTIFVDSIKRDSSDRLKSRVNLRWQGLSKDDYIKGYKVLFSFSPFTNVLASFDTVKNITTRTDSIFQFTIPRGSNNGNLYFSVQAITSRGAKDINPPVLLVPIVNTPPTSKWDARNLPANDTVLSVITLPVVVDDFDGINTIDSVQVRANFGAWVTIPRTTSVLCLVGSNPYQAGVQDAKVYSADGKTILPFSIPNFKIDDFNRFELRAIDASGAKSRPDTTPAIYIRRQTSDLLVMEANYTSQLEDFYRSTISSDVYTTGFDFLSLTANDGIDKPKIWSPTIDVLFRQYKKIIWYNDAKNSPDGTTFPLLLNTAYPQLRTFERNGGKILISCPFPKLAEALDATSPVFSILPIDISAFAGGTAFANPVLRIGRNNLLVSKFVSSGYSSLKLSANLSSVDPFTPTPDSDTLYTAAAIDNSTGTYSGSKILAVKRSGIQGNRTSMIYFSVELQKLNGDVPALKALFTQILNNEFRP